MKINLDAPSEEVRIEIIPLIDVIFCILTFFILAAVGLTRQMGINVDLPTATTGTTQMREMLVVSVDPVGQIYVEQEPIARNQLTQLLLDYRLNSPEGLVVLYASRSARYADVVEVLDLLRSVGGDRVALATLPESSDENQLESPEFNFDLDQPLPADPFSSPDDALNAPGSVEPFEFDQNSLPDDLNQLPKEPNGDSSPPDN
ncbi:MAG: ExbD/TolR family protein [Elainellaceae cyanobacterium]